VTDPKVPLVPLSATPPSQPDDLPPAPVAAGTPDATIALKLYPPGPVPAMPNRRRNLVAKMAQRRAINRR
jgi:hypothetical protein